MKYQELKNFVFEMISNYFYVSILFLKKIKVYLPDKKYKLSKNI